MYKKDTNTAVVAGGRRGKDDRKLNLLAPLKNTEGECQPRRVEEEYRKERLSVYFPL
jgi:hypothetical protein